MNRAALRPLPPKWENARPSCDSQPLIQFRQLTLTRGVRRLILPGEMGEAVKFMMLTRGIEPGSFEAEPAFTLQDLRASL